jgi:hypothetical protein
MQFVRKDGAEENSLPMPWPEFFPWWIRQNGIGQSIDLGNNRFLSAEDVLDGHFRRLSSRTVKVQVQNDLQTAIAVLAPGLAPLTELATEVAGVVPQVHPGAQFRQDLHRALELTHRQHSAQRKLGTHPTAPAFFVWHRLIAATIVGLALATFILYLRSKRKLAEV